MFDYLLMFLKERHIAFFHISGMYENLELRKILKDLVNIN